MRSPCTFRYINLRDIFGFHRHSKAWQLLFAFSLES